MNKSGLFHLSFLHLLTLVYGQNIIVYKEFYMRCFMSDYFLLQYKMSNRKMAGLGINPLLAYILCFAGFVLLAIYLFETTEFAKYVVMLSSLIVLIGLSEHQRAEFLLITFGDFKKKMIRIVENMLCIIPFVAILCYHHAFKASLGLFVLSILMASFSLKTKFKFTIPTPFSKYPFEFTIGFRQSWLVLTGSYVLTIIALIVDNLNLGIFSLLLLFLIASSYYSKLENELYVWVYTDQAKDFLWRKLKSATINICILSSPGLFGLLLFYPSRFVLILLFFCLGLVFLCTLILAKYAAYPRGINLPLGILVASSLYFPPLLLAVLPFLYVKSVKKLKIILNDKDQWAE